MAEQPPWRTIQPPKLPRFTGEADGCDADEFIQEAERILRNFRMDEGTAVEWLIQALEGYAHVHPPPPHTHTHRTRARAQVTHTSGKKGAMPAWFVTTALMTKRAGIAKVTKRAVVTKRRNNSFARFLLQMSKLVHSSLPLPALGRVTQVYLYLCCWSLANRTKCSFYFGPLKINGGNSKYLCFDCIILKKRKSTSVLFSLLPSFWQWAFAPIPRSLAS